VDYCPFGDLYTLIKQNRKADEYDRLTTTEKYIIWIQIAFGIVSMHERGLVYRDLKPENILINEFGEAKICDFGFACKIEADKKLTELCGSYEYLAPEMIKREGYGKPLDLYCLGLLFYELMVGYNPYEGITPENINEIKNKPINF
jgi:protein kinase A